VPQEHIGCSQVLRHLAARAQRERQDLHQQREGQVERLGPGARQQPVEVEDTGQAHPVANEGSAWPSRLPPALLCLTALIPLLALLNVFGQSPDVKKVANPNGAATLELSAPTKVRSGLLFEARFDIRARRDIKDAVLVLDSGWMESLTLNSLEPSPAEETSRNGGIALDLGEIPQGKLWRRWNRSTSTCWWSWATRSSKASRRTTTRCNLRRARIAKEELAEEARLSQVVALGDVAWAVLETSGKISIFPKKG
jgi:hypothetical protein